MEQLVQMLDLVAGRFEDFADSNVVVGDAVTLDKVTIVPLIRLSVGFGGGGGQGEGDFTGHPKGKGPAKGGAGKGSGGGAGAGGKARPVGLIVFDDDGVSVHSIPHKKGLLDKLFDKVPQVIEMVKKVQGQLGDSDESNEVEESESKD